nr:hypothetical protein [Streptococcus mutans]
MNHLNQTYNSIKYRYNGLPNKIQIIIIALSVSLIYILPLLTISNGVLNGDDLHFHIDRMLGLSSIWKSPVNFRTFYKVGQGVNYFYPFYRYKGQVVTVDNRLVSSALSKSGSTAIHLPNGIHEIRVTYYYTAVARVAFVTSIIVIIVTIIYAVLYHLIEKHRIAFKIRQGLFIYY